MKCGCPRVEEIYQYAAKRKACDWVLGSLPSRGTKKRGEKGKRTGLEGSYDVQKSKWNWFLL